MSKVSGYSACWYCGDMGIDLPIWVIKHAGEELRVHVCRECTGHADNDAPCVYVPAPASYWAPLPAGPCETYPETPHMAALRALLAR